MTTANNRTVILLNKFGGAFRVNISAVGDMRVGQILQFIRPNTSAFYDYATLTL